MGLDYNGARFLMAEKARGVRLGRLLTLGRQSIYMEPSESEALASDLGIVGPFKWADAVFEAIGVDSLTAMDVSDYEGASVIHDMNEPIADGLKQSFDTVLDGGTLEHVFNFPVALRNCMELVRLGGVFIAMAPWHNYSGHGFYELSPELFYRALSPENGFVIETMRIFADGRWYEVLDPAEISQRVEIFTNERILIYLTARRNELREVFAKWPQQSDYESAWASGGAGAGTGEPTRSMHRQMLQLLPGYHALRRYRETRRFRNSRKPSVHPGFRVVSDPDGNSSSRG